MIEGHPRTAERLNMAIYDAPAEELIQRVAQELEKEETMQPPEWAPFVKTGMHKERQPTQKNWWHIRSASVLRKIFSNGPIGVSKLKVEYGGKKNRGMKPELFYPASGNILRKILQQLEKTGLAKQGEKGVYRGRIVTPKGHAMLEAAASAILKEKGITLKEKPKTELPIAEKKKKKKTVKKKTTKKKTTKKKAAKKDVKKTEPKKEEKKETKKEPEKDIKKEEAEPKKETKNTKEPAKEEPEKKAEVKNGEQ